MKRVRRWMFAGALVATTPLLLLTIPAAEATTGTLVITESHALPEDHQGNIVIDADNVVLNCAGHRVIGSAPVGIEVKGRNQVQIRNCILKGFETAIKLTDSHLATIQGGDVTGASIGCHLVNSNSNTVDTIMFRDNGASGCVLDGSNYNTFHDVMFSGNGGSGLYLNNSGGNTFTGMNSSGNQHGVDLVWSSNNVLRNNAFNGNTLHGASVHGGERNELSWNTTSQNGADAIAITSTSGNLIRSNGGSVNGVGIAVGVNSTHNSINDNVYCGNNAWDAYQLPDGTLHNSFMNNRFSRVSGIPEEGYRRC